ncbi:MAG: hypothetical protein JW778_07875 [Candidatus Altiarchaeota archaeon]|nr:hypothetical protein [Candidatus Altiarchaeota archaeon]
MSILSDDIGSFPLPADVDKKRLQGIGLAMVRGEASDSGKKQFNEVVSEMMREKIDSGIVRPNFPQVMDMISSFSEIIEDFCEPEEPWVVRKKYAVIPEVSALDGVARKHFKEGGTPLELRVCVTGPLELYLAKAGLQVQGDLLQNLAHSVSRFIENSILDKKHLKTKTVCIDEPSLGLNPNIVADRDDLISALETAVGGVDLDVQIHIHSPNSVDLVYEVDGIDVIGIESAEDPKALGEIDLRDLESYDKFLRVGVSRTNIYGIVADYRGKKESSPKNPVDAVSLSESTEVISRRLDRAYRIFGERIMYAGPDCGLGGWPDQESAFQLLKNTAVAVKGFNRAKGGVKDALS